MVWCWGAMVVVVVVVAVAAGCWRGGSRRGRGRVHLQFTTAGHTREELGGRSAPWKPAATTTATTSTTIATQHQPMHNSTRLAALT